MSEVKIEEKKKPGRKSRADAIKELRAERVPFGKMRGKMDVPQHILDNLKKEGMVPYWFNDENHGQRIRTAKSNGYQFVDTEGTIKVGSKEVDEGRRMRVLVGDHKDGSAKHAYLMAIPIELHTEDRQAKEDVNFKIDESIRAGTPKGSQSLNVSGDLASVQAKEISYKP